MKRTKITFSNTEERDQFIKEKFPERTCSDEPGHFFVPNGNLFVFCNTIEYEQL